MPEYPEKRDCLGLYVHVPFCEGKCRYCGFFSECLGGIPYEETGDRSQEIVGREEAKGRIGVVIDAMVKEMEGYDLSGVDTVYVGGGSPSAIPEEELTRLLEYVQNRVGHKKGTEAEDERLKGTGTPQPLQAAFEPVLFNRGKTPFCEFTVEVNPGQVTLGKLRKMRALGVNRLSIGAQSFDDDELAFLGRRHKAADVVKCVASARKAGFANISIDLIFAIPGQSMDDWKRMLEEAMRLGVEHISAYALTYEEGTPLHAAREKGEVVPVDEELDRAMYAAAIDMLGAAGYQQYEISNFAKPGYECRHNLKYWANDEYVGIGPAAASWYNGTRWTNVASIDGYVAGIQESHHGGTEDTEKTSDTDRSEGRHHTARARGPRMSQQAHSDGYDGGHREDEGRRGNLKQSVRVEEHRPNAKEMACETAVLNLRRMSGIELEEYKRRTGFDAMELFGDVIRKQQGAGMLKVTGGRVFLTREALPVADGVLCGFAEVDG